MKLALAVSAGLTGVLTWSGAPVLGAAPGWSTPQALSVTGSAEDPQVAAANGRALVVWEQETAQGSRIMVAGSTRGVWGDPRPVSPIGDRVASGQQVAMNDSGRAVVTWQRDGRIFAAVRAAGRWSARRQLTTAGRAAFPQVAVTAAGRAYVVWEQMQGIHEQVVVVRRSAEGAWSRPRVLPSGFDDAQRPQVAVDAQGHAIVVWQRMWGDGGRSAVLAARFADGRWGGTRRLSASGHNAGEPLLAMTPRGGATVLWSARRSGHVVVQGVERPVAGPWSAVRTLDRGGLGDLAVAPSGAGVVSWIRSTSSGYRFGLTMRTAGGAWQPGVVMGPVDPFTEAPVVAIGGGAVAVSWMTDAVQAQRRDGGSWGPATTVGGSGVSYYQQVAIDSAGRAVVVWKEWNGSHDVVMTSSSPTG